MKNFQEMFSSYPNRRQEAILNFTEEKVRELIENVDNNYSIVKPEKIDGKLRFQVINMQTGMTGEEVHKIFIEQYKLLYLDESQTDRIQLVSEDDGIFVEIELNQ